MATKYEYYTTTGGTNGYVQLNTIYFWGQTFTVGTTGTNENFNISSIKLRLSRTGSPGTLTFAIRATSGGLPTGSDLSTGTTNGDTLNSAAFELREITMSSCQLNSSTKYVILGKSATFEEDVNECEWEVGDPDPGYSGGKLVIYTGSWEEVEGDACFEVWGAVEEEGTNTQINIGDSWHAIEAAQINIGDTWKPVAGMQINIGDDWKTIF